MYLLFILSCHKHIAPVSTEPEVYVSMILEDTPVLPQRNFAWTTRPNIINCKNKSPISLRQLKKQVEFYTDFGEEIGTITEQECLWTCERFPNTITITNKSCTFAEYEDKPAAWTSWERDDNDIYSAVVELDSTYPSIVRHELGHAFGWGHSSILGHQMFPFVEFIGDITYGMYETDIKIYE